MAELLLELLSEEIPARMQAHAAENLKQLVREDLHALNLHVDQIETFVTPRRLTVVVAGLPTLQPDVIEERRGPRIGSPEKAVQGFLKSVGLSRLDQCQQRDTGKGVFWFASTTRRGRDTASLVAELLPSDAAFTLSWAKQMRWADSELSYVRPLHCIICVFDGHAVGGTVDFKGGIQIELGDTTKGHRFLAPKPIVVANFADYRSKLLEAFVILDPAERRQHIREEAEGLAAREGLKVKPDDALLDEVVGLVEWPAVLMGRIDEAYMEVPPEVLITAMRTHQKYFALLDRDGNLAPRFLLVSNMPHEVARDRTIVAGNERVLRARLADAKFFWDQDCKTVLADRVPALRDIIFHARLGTMAEKVERLRALAAELVPALRNSYRVDTGAAEFARHADRAALLCKADLTTGMVGEFPELQGIMGRYYARHGGEPASVADAIAEHYAPLGPADRCPTAPVSVAVALADKIDTLAGFFAIGEQPTGSKDPYALRRAALGIIRLIVENNLRLRLSHLFYKALTAKMGDESSPHVQREKANELIEFLADRLKVALREKGVRHDLIAAVFALGGEDDLVRLLARVEALGRFLESEDGVNLLTAWKRAGNIVRIEEKKDSTAYAGPVQRELLRQPEEIALASALDAAQERMHDAIEAEDFAGAMTALARLRPAVDAFFDKVTVNTDDPDLRINRLRLLSQIRATLGGVADFSRIEG